MMNTITELSNRITKGMKISFGEGKPENDRDNLDYYVDIENGDIYELFDNIVKKMSKDAIGYQESFHSDFSVSTEGPWQIGTNWDKYFPNGSYHLATKSFKLYKKHNGKWHHNANLKMRNDKLAENAIF